MELEKSHKLGTQVTGFQDRFLGCLYGSVWGRLLIRPLVTPAFSKIGGWLLDTRLSALAVKPFVRANHIDLSICKKQNFHSYNDFFTRELKEDARPVDLDENAIVSPCDARLTVYPITEDGRFLIKHTQYTVTELLKNSKLADRFMGGTIWLYRLCVDDYHRYIFPENGVVSHRVHIPGVFHTVNPVANDQYPIYKENTREYSLIRTKEHGTVLMMEVGAMLVGKIENHKLTGKIRRGQEKGNFAFGGSTIIVMTQKDRAIPESCFTDNTELGIETKVKLGQKVGASR